MCHQDLRIKNLVIFLTFLANFLFYFALKMDINVYYSTILVGIIGNRL